MANIRRAVLAATANRVAIALGVIARSGEPGRGDTLPALGVQPDVARERLHHA